MFISTQVILWTLFSAAALIAFMIGRLLEFKEQDETIEKTILFLVDNDMVRWETNDDGEIELLPLNK
jgi:hypothetical protein